MRTRRRVLVLGLVGVAAMLASGCLAVGEPTTIESGSRAWDVNDAGLVVGSHWLTNPITLEDRAFTYDTATGTKTELGTLGGSVSSARGVNDQGVVVGYSTLANGQTRAFRWAGSGLQDLGTLTPAATTPWSFAYDVNDDGLVVGRSSLETGATDDTHAFVYDPGTGVMTDLGTLGGANSAALAINDDGVIVGWSEVVGGARHPFVYDPVTGVMEDLGTLGGVNGEATDLNDSGIVVGWSETGTGDPCAEFIGAPGPVCPVTAGFVHDLASGTTTALRIPLDNTHVTVSGVNDDGVVVATATDKSQPWCSHCLPPSRAVAFELEGTDGSGAYRVAGNLHAASAISDTGIVVGTGIDTDGFAQVPFGFHATVTRDDG